MPHSITTLAFAAAFVLAAGTPIAAQSASTPQVIAIYFPSGKAELTEQALAVIDETAKLAREQPSTQIVVVGRTDSSGSDETNDRIAMERATNTRDALIERDIDPANVTVISRPAREARGTPDNFITERRADVIISPTATSL